MRKSIVEGDDFSVLPPYAVRLGRKLRAIVDRLGGNQDEERAQQAEDEDRERT
jgi:hypothetical protein